MPTASSSRSRRPDDTAAIDQVASSPSRSSVIATRAGLRSSVKGQVILDEEEYVAALSYLIRRDFFPDNEGVAVAYTEDGEEVSDAYLPAKVVQHLGPAAAGALTIGTFQANFTSDDNASFQDILENEKQRRKAAYAWAYEAESKHGSKSKARNALFYPPSAIQPSSRADRLLTTADGRTTSSKQIEHRRTRLGADDVDEVSKGSQAGSMTPRSSRIDAAIDGEGSVSELSGVDEGESDGQQYGFVRPVASPRFQDLDRKQQAEMMTWGKIASTPRAVEEEGEDGLYDGRFRIPATPKLDALARSLAGKTNIGRASSSSSSSNRRKVRGSHTGTPTTPGRRTPSDLTPAARTLLERTRKRKSG